jgi:xylulokinase
MSLMGIDVGTTGVKAVVFNDRGWQIAAAYEEYDFRRLAPGWAELDAEDVWAKARRVIQRCAVASTGDPIQAISFSSMGEAMVPVTGDRRIMGPSINPNFDLRGEAYVQELAVTMPDSRLYAINGNTLGHNYSLVTLKWLKEHRPQIYTETDHFLLWSSFIAFMLGAEARVDYSLANRTLLFDLVQKDWSDELVAWAGLDREKLPETIASGQEIGRVSEQVAAELGLPAGALLISGTHDQCATAIGCGVIEEGLATFGMGTFFNISPVFRAGVDSGAMMERGISTEHHAVPDLFVSFLYNLGGALVKWYRDTFATLEHRLAQEAGSDIYADLFAEMPTAPSSVLVLPHFGPTGPPDFISESRGVVAGLQLDTQRGDILKGIVEGVAFYLKEVVDSLPPTGIIINEYRATGGGAKSDAWLQVVADIMGLPVVRPAVTEAGALGAAILAGVGCGRFASYQEGVEAMVSLDQTFAPDPDQNQRYQQRYEKYKALWPLMEDYLRDLAAG